MLRWFFLGRRVFASCGEIWARTLSRKRRGACSGKFRDLNRGTCETYRRVASEFLAVLVAIESSISPMKITAIETLVCHARMRNWIFVKVVTDQPGLVGWGEATLEWHTRSVVGAIEDLAELIVGEDPRRVEHLWQM